MTADFWLALQYLDARLRKTGALDGHPGPRRQPELEDLVAFQQWMSALPTQVASRLLPDHLPVDDPAELTDMVSELVEMHGARNEIPRDLGGWVPLFEYSDGTAAYVAGRWEPDGAFSVFNVAFREAGSMFLEFGSLAHFVFWVGSHWTDEHLHGSVSLEDVAVSLAE